MHTKSEKNPNDDNKFHHPLWSGFVDLFAGSIGGVATVLVGQPLDTIKVKMQTFPTAYPNPLVCFTKTLKQDGLFRGLYAGTTPSLAANVAENAVLFCAYGYCQKLVSEVTGRHENEMTIIDKATSGFFAAFFSSFALCPTELIKCKLQSMRETNSNPMSAMKLTRSILQQNGVRGLYNGLTSTFAREMPGYFAFFGGIESTRTFIRTNPTLDKNINPTFESILAGGIGGACLWLTIFPFDLVKSRIQIENSKLNLRQMLSKIIKEEGFRNLYCGLTPTLLRTFPATAALLVSVEWTQKLLL